MKHDWEYKKLGEVATLVTDGDWIESKDQSDSGIRLIQTGNIGNGQFKAKEDKPHYISKETMSRLDCTEVFEGDCLVSRLPDPVGRACIIPQMGCRMITAVDCSIIRFGKDYLPQTFIYYTQSSSYSTSIANSTTGTTRKRISRKNLENVSIPVPPIEEQKAICSLLDKLNLIIEKKKQQVKELDNLAQSIFYDMFGDPVANEKGWEVKKLKDVGSIITGSTPATSNPDNYASTDICFVKPSDIEKEGITTIKSTEFYVSNHAYDTVCRKLPKGSVLTTCIGIIGKIGVLSIDATCNQQINAVIPSPSMSSTYLAYAILSIRDYIQDVANAPVVPIINKGQFSSFQIPVPPLPLQQAFASKVEAIERQKELINQSIREAQTLFDSRMEYYFGE